MNLVPWELKVEKFWPLSLVKKEAKKKSERPEETRNFISSSWREFLDVPADKKITPSLLLVLSNDNTELMTLGWWNSKAFVRERERVTFGFSQGPNIQTFLSHFERLPVSLFLHSKLDESNSFVYFA